MQIDFQILGQILKPGEKNSIWSFYIIIICIHYYICFANIFFRINAAMFMRYWCLIFLFVMQLCVFVFRLMLNMQWIRKCFLFSGRNSGELVLFFFFKVWWHSSQSHLSLVLSFLEGINYLTIFYIRNKLIHITYFS